MASRPPEVRSSEDGEKLTIAGYAAVFNSESEVMWDFVEVLEPGAFDQVLESDVRGLKNHDNNLILGRTSAGTLRIEQDEIGLRYEIDLPNTQLGRDTYEEIRAGLLKESSFSFTINPDGTEWSTRSDGLYVRKIKKGGIGRLFDVGPVAFPAYPAASVNARSLPDGPKPKENYDAYYFRLRAEAGIL